MKIVALLPLLALAGCGMFGGGSPAQPEERAEYRACRSEAANSPEVRALAQQSNPDNVQNGGRIGGIRAREENRVFRECLRRQGLALPGGVESVRQR